MPRPFPWLPRLPEIRRTVANSVRSHYSRRELELLFRISPRSAGRLLELLATEPVGTAHLVSRDALAGFLAEVTEADDVAALCERIREGRANLTRVKARYLLPRDELEVPFTSLPDKIRIEPGLLTLRFESMEDLCVRLVQLSQAMRDDPVEFERRCEGQTQRELSPEALDARYINEQIEWMKQQTEKPPAGEGGGHNSVRGAGT